MEVGLLGRLTSLDYRRVEAEIVKFIQRYVRDSGLNGVVVGLSGGLDSSTTAYLAVRALGRGRVLGLIMPDTRVTPPNDVADAKMVAELLGIAVREIDIAPIHHRFMEFLEADKLSEANLRARIRMCLLYYHANRTRRAVIGTGDRSEILIGYYTKYGDGGVDLLPIGGLYKTQVRKLARHLGVPAGVVAKKSSPALWPGQTAEGELGLTYEVIDQVLYGLFDLGLNEDEVARHAGVMPEVVQRVMALHQESHHKRELPPVCGPFRP
jgi:NAD+ synthase